MRDVTSNIERRKVRECPDCGRIVDADRGFCQGFRGDRHAHALVIETEVVSATDYQGAVDALRWALGFIEYQGEPSPLNDPREGETDAESYRRAQALVGGS